MALAQGPHVVAVPGATRAETARSAARAATLEVRVPQQPQEKGGQPAKGKSCSSWASPVRERAAWPKEWVARGYQRLNRDERGGSLKALAAALEDHLAGGATRVVLDNTYLTRASRNQVIDVDASAWAWPLDASGSRRRSPGTDQPHRADCLTTSAISRRRSSCAKSRVPGFTPAHGTDARVARTRAADEARVGRRRRVAFATRAESGRRASSSLRLP